MWQVLIILPEYLSSYPFWLFNLVFWLCIVVWPWPSPIYGFWLSIFFSYKNDIGDKKIHKKINSQTNKKQGNKQKQNRIILQIKQYYILPLVILMYVDKGGEYVDVDTMTSFLTHFLSVVVFPSNMNSVDKQLKYEYIMFNLLFNWISISALAKWTSVEI